jgi:hypothetical protein
MLYCGEYFIRSFKTIIDIQCQLVGFASPSVEALEVISHRMVTGIGL